MEASQCFFVGACLQAKNYYVDAELRKIASRIAPTEPHTVERKGVYE
jgi:hypothetical protein